MTLSDQSLLSARSNAVFEFGNECSYSSQTCLGDTLVFLSSDRVVSSFVLCRRLYIGFSVTNSS